MERMFFDVTVNNKKTRCNVITTYEGNNKKFVAYTTGATDTSGELIIIVSSYVVDENDNYVLSPINVEEKKIAEVVLNGIIGGMAYE